METDLFIFKSLPKNKPYTRRGILSTTSSISDPLGIISPVVLSAKKLIQDLCKQGLHNFADASEIAYGAVSNIRFVNEEWNAVHCSFLV